MAQRDELLGVLGRLIDLDPATFSPAPAPAPAPPPPRNLSGDHALKPLDTTLGKVTITSESANPYAMPSAPAMPFTDMISSPATPLAAVTAKDLALARPLTPSIVPSALNIVFTPALQPPKYGLIIRQLGAGPGAGFINVHFRNCTFDSSSPTIFENCWLSNVTFSNCHFTTSHFENVAIRGADFETCSFECFWMNIEREDMLKVTGQRYQGLVTETAPPKRILALNKARREERDARLSNPAAPTEEHHSGLGTIKGFDTRENEYRQYQPVKKPEPSREASIIPLSAVNGLTFENTPRAGLFVQANSGSKYEDVQFIRCTFKDTHFNNCHMVGVVFEDCEFVDATFEETVFHNRRYEKCDFDKCSWKWRMLVVPTTLTKLVYRQRSEYGPALPRIIVDQAKAQNKECKKAEKFREAVVKAQRPVKQEPSLQVQVAPIQAVSDVPRGLYAQNNLRRDPLIKTADEIVRERMRPGDKMEVRTVPGAVVRNPNEKLLSTTFVQMDVSSW